MDLKEISQVIKEKRKAKNNRYLGCCGRAYRGMLRLSIQKCVGNIKEKKPSLVCLYQNLGSFQAIIFIDIMCD